MKLTLWLVASPMAAMLLLDGSPAQSKPGSCPVAGQYWLVGRLPGATGSYRGEAKISAKGGGCHMKWFPPNDSQGTGTFRNDTNRLTVHFTFKGGGSGVVRYDRTFNGDLYGTWWMNNTPSQQGVEVLSRHGPPQLSARSPTPSPPPAASRSSGASRFIFMLNRASSSVTIYQDGVQKCAMQPGASCGDVWVQDGTSTTLRAVFSTGSETTSHRPAGVPLHVCIDEGPRFVECLSDEPL